MKDNTLVVTLRKRNFEFVCPKHEIDKLKQAALYLDDRMAEIEENGRAVGIERTAIMAAINMAHELLEERKKLRTTFGLLDRVKRLRTKVQRALKQTEQMELFN